MKVNFVCETDGKGLWSSGKKPVRVRELQIKYRDYEENFGELIALFDKRCWNPDKHGLIYTDVLWIKEFRQQLVKLGFSKKAAKDVSYSEQGMQGDNYVSLDAGTAFMKEWDEKNRLDARAAL
mgnify:CR=1 FL=1